MPTVIDMLPGAYFTLRIYKRLTSNPALKWANAYELVNLVETSETSINNVVAAFWALEQQMHLEDVEFDRAVFSTWVPDGDPYDPNTFVTIPLSLYGNKSAVTPLSLNNCLFIRRKTTTGQNGRIFWRRCLNENEVEAPAGVLSLNNPDTLQDALDTAVTSSGVQEYLDGTSAFQLVMKSALPIQRDVNALIVAGARVMQFNNRYFDVP